ncbi:putative uncharacterized protein DDB_G0286901 [Contarinia nasturtii]|uniref:putative uncharacterized protein DDB_G0286901 n=1 Tax=Contarinia nasturtii TaxID=265458 RepID=UPI0012D3EDF6|nr:putative uncharacterized protein DDB_G0286901 [Contarinia nasturtii]
MKNNIKNKQNKRNSIEMMDEKLIAEVQQHAIIYNRQKSSTINGDKCITKEIAWQDIARNLGTDVDTCKKRWKYLRERYVQQKKVGGSPASYEHLSRPYLEKMKFLDTFIQSRKSYRQVSQLFQSPSALQSFDGNESSKSNGSMRLLGGGHLNNDLDDAFPQYYLNHQFPHANLVVKNEENSVSDMHRKPIDLQSSNNNMPSSSSSSIASQESPTSSAMHRKRRRTTSTNISERNNSHNLNNSNSYSIERTHDPHQKQILNNNLSDNDEHHNINDDDDDDDDDASDHQSSSMNNVPTDFLYPLYEQHTSRTRKSTTDQHTNPTSSTFPNPVDLLYQHAIARQLRSSDQLLGELVTSELTKMPKDRKKVVQRKILEVLFFDDE